MPPTYNELKDMCEAWLNDSAGTLALPRQLFLVTGWTDEDGGCWTDAPNSMEYWGNRVFSNWTERRTIIRFPNATQNFAFPAGFQVGTIALGGMPMADFRDFADLLRAAIRTGLPAGAGDGEYDLVCHSMGGLNSFAALVPLPSARPLPAAEAIPAANNYVTLDTPFRGVPNISFIAPASGPRHTQADAIKVGSPLLQEVVDNRAKLVGRTQTLACFGVDTASYVEVPKTSSDLMAPVGSAQLFQDDGGESVRGRLKYVAPLIPGAVHSGGGGITANLITITNVFLALTGEELAS